MGEVGAATVGIYWAGNLINAGPITRARHRTVLSWRLNCPVCDRNCLQTTCDHQASFVAHALDLFFGYIRDSSYLRLETRLAAGRMPDVLQPVSSGVSEYE